MYNLFETKWRHAAEAQKEDDESIQVKGDNWMQIHQDQRIRHSLIFFKLNSVPFFGGGGGGGREKKKMVCVFLFCF